MASALRVTAAAAAAIFLALCAQAAAAELPLETTSAPPAGHHADPSLTTHVFRLPIPRAGPYAVLRQNDLAKPPPVRGSIVAMDARLVEANGREIPQNVLMLHHLLFTNGGPDGRRRDAACPERHVNERFYGTSEELRPMTFPRGYGYPTDPGDRWRSIWMVMNHTQRIIKSYIEYRVTVDPRPGIQPVTPYWLSVLSCARSLDPQFSIPGGRKRGSIERRSRNWKLPRGGRIVAIGGHLHGGATGIGMSQPRCGNRSLFMARPTYAPAGDPLYRVRPMLHEPDPKNISWFQSATGFAARAGERVRVTARYDGSRPHTRVMGIVHLYLAHGASGGADCGATPSDSSVFGAGFKGRSKPPRVRLTLAAFNGSRRARSMLRPPGPIRVLDGGTTVRVRRYRFRPLNLSIPVGSSIRWVFADRTRHDATVVTGPRGFASPTTGSGHSFRHQFTVPGLYRMHCSIHPVAMSASVRVRGRAHRHRR